jgi:antitoxin ParD1/3/4
MPARHTLHVALTKPLVTYVAQQVMAGRYVSASAVVRAGLQLLIERNEAELPSLQSPDKTAASNRVENV